MGKSKQRKWYDYGDDQDGDNYKKKEKDRRKQKKNKYHMKTSVGDKFNIYDERIDED